MAISSTASASGWRPSTTRARSITVLGVYLTTRRVRTVHGEADLAGLRAEAERIFGESPLFSVVSLGLESPAPGTPSMSSN